MRYVLLYKFLRNRRLAWLIPAFCAITVLSGCGLIFNSPSYTPVNYYDLGRPLSHKTPPVRIKIGTVRCEGPENTRMTFRVSRTHVQFDEYNRWDQSPEKMLRRFLMQYINDPALSDGNVDKPTLILDLRLLCFECDLTKNQAFLVVEALAKKPAPGEQLVLSETYHQSIDLKDKTATAYAEAMSTAVHAMTSKLTQKLIELAPKL